MLIAVSDIEATGFGSTHVISQVASAIVDTEKASIVAQGSVSIRLTDNEVKEANEKALEVQGWTKEANEAATDRTLGQQQFMDWLDGFGIDAFAAHNAPFDRRMLLKDGWVKAEVPWLCTLKGLKLYRNLHRVQLENNKLESLAAVCGYEQKQAHNALDDTFACANGLLHMVASGVALNDMML